MKKNFIVIEWPEIQDLMHYNWYTRECHLVNDEKGLAEYGSSAYFVPTERYQEHLDAAVKDQVRTGKPYYIKFARLTNLPQMRVKSTIPNSPDAALWAASEEAAIQYCEKELGMFNVTVELIPEKYWKK